LSPTLRGKYELRVSEYWVLLKRIFRRKKREIMEGWRIFMFSLLDKIIIRMVKSSGVRMTRHIALMGRSACKV
jgi:hypothetical protein